jgi:hypothetical protein
MPINNNYLGKFNWDFEDFEDMKNCAISLEGMVDNLKNLSDEEIIELNREINTRYKVLIRKNKLKKHE